VIPHLNRALYESLRAEFPETPFVTLITDLADYPPHFWFEPQDQHFICDPILPSSSRGRRESNREMSGAYRV
jgi:hypothetical protein